MKRAEDELRRGKLRCSHGGVAVALVALLLAGCDDSGGEPEGTNELSTVRVETAPIVETTLRRWITVYGQVEPMPPADGRPGGIARVAAPVAGTVASVSCHEGQRVSPGDLLLQLDSRVADAAVAAAADAVRFAEITVERRTSLLPAGGASERTVQEARQVLARAEGELASARAQQALLSVRSPLAGSVTRIVARVGQGVDQSVVLAEIADGSRTVVTLSVPSGEANGLHRGQRVELELGRKRVASELVYVSPAVDAATGTRAVRAAVPPREAVAIGTFVSARILIEERENRLVAPAASVVEKAGACTVVVVEGDVARPEPVECGVREGDLVEVSSPGLRAGTVVVTTGAYGIDREVRVRTAVP